MKADGVPADEVKEVFLREVEDYMSEKEPILERYFDYELAMGILKAHVIMKTKK